MTEPEKKPAGDIRPYFRAMNSSRAVRRGMVRVMNDMQAGRISHQIAGKMLYGLNCVQGSLDSQMIEQRLAALEEQAEARAIPGEAVHTEPRAALMLVHDAER